MHLNCTRGGSHNDTHTATDRVEVQHMEKLVPWEKKKKELRSVKEK